MPGVSEAKRKVLEKAAKAASYHTVTQLRRLSRPLSIAVAVGMFKRSFDTLFSASGSP